MVSGYSNVNADSNSNPRKDAPPRVLCVSGPNWFGVSRLPLVLAAAGFEVSALAHPDSFVACSRFLHSLVPGSLCPRENLELFRRHLAGGARYDWVIFADDPTMMEAVRRCREEWLLPWFPTDGRGGDAHVLIDKTLFVEKAAAAGLPVPPFCPIVSSGELCAAAAELGFPVIAAPTRWRIFARARSPRASGVCNGRSVGALAEQRCFYGTAARFGGKIPCAPRCGQSRSGLPVAGPPFRCPKCRRF
ncbi:MAG: hypothetical protein EBS01_09330 [Verrucomicrobia bacterium]|nr:hypothetical protein [Verrucomicrobiota bacterium]